MESKDHRTKRAVLDLSGAHCMSCVYTIEHVGRKQKGVADVFVDVATSKIHVEYDGNEQAIETIIDVVRRLGYEARLGIETGG